MRCRSSVERGGGGGVKLRVRHVMAMDWPAKNLVQKASRLGLGRGYLKQVNHVLIQPHWRNDCDHRLV